MFGDGIMKIKDIILVVLILMVVSMGGYLVYDKVLREDDIITDDNKYVTEDGNVVDNKDNVNDRYPFFICSSYHPFY